jgi:hypothetical protein
MGVVYTHVVLNQSSIVTMSSGMGYELGAGCSASLLAQAFREEAGGQGALSFRAGPSFLLSFLLSIILTSLGLWGQVLIEECQQWIG